eukprot:6507794-Pyramimonas_sp.AAC.1
MRWRSSVVTYNRCPLNKAACPTVTSRYPPVGPMYFGRPCLLSGAGGRLDLRNIFVDAGPNGKVSSSIDSRTR